MTKNTTNIEAWILREKLEFLKELVGLTKEKVGEGFEGLGIWSDRGKAL